MLKVVTLIHVFVLVVLTGRKISHGADGQRHRMEKASRNGMAEYQFIT